jgi:hypothetical protein
MMRRVSLVAVMSLFVACSDAPTPAPSNVYLTCIREAVDGTITCTNEGDDDHSVNGGEGGAGGQGGSPSPTGQGGGTEITKYITCISYDAYAGQGSACMSPSDCPASDSPCEIVKCVNGACDTGWHVSGTVPCEGPGYTCTGSYCCGLDDNPF